MDIVFTPVGRAIPDNMGIFKFKEFPDDHQPPLHLHFDPLGMGDGHSNRIGNI